MKSQIADAFEQIRPHKTRYATRDRVREQAQMIMLGLGSIYEGLVIVLSLGYLNTNIRGWMLFTWFDED